MLGHIISEEAFFQDELNLYFCRSKMKPRAPFFRIVKNCNVKFNRRWAKIKTAPVKFRSSFFYVFGKFGKSLHQVPKPLS